MPDLCPLPGWLYRQYDADYGLDVPAEGFDGWHRLEVPLDLSRTALAVMHAWDTGESPADFPGWYATVEYFPRANRIVREVFPPLLEAVRAAGLPVVHVTSGDHYVRELPGYRAARELVRESPPSRTTIELDPQARKLQQLREREGGNGPHNRADIQRGFERLKIPAEAMPKEHDLIAPNDHVLDACCRHLGVNHLLYAGFAINWCLLTSPGSMLDMRRRGYLCSAIREAVTAVENRESARTESHKEEALWRVARSFGFVFDLPDLLAALPDRR